MPRCTLLACAILVFWDVRILLTSVHFCGSLRMIGTVLRFGGSSVEEVEGVGSAILVLGVDVDVEGGLLTRMVWGSF